MSKKKNHITVFEHESIRLGKGEKCLSEEQYKALQKYYGNGVPYYQLIHNGVKFNEHVGVIQVGKTIIEVLPKADKLSTTIQSEKGWRDMLIGMLRAVGSFEIKSTSNSNLKIKPNTILDLYFEQFIKEVECLIRNGIIKKYRKTEGNNNALKGNLLFNKNIQHNSIHHERFYIKYTTYDVEHIFHLILYKTIRLLQQINTNASLQSRIGSLLLNFPEMPDIKVSEVTFEKLVFNRKTQSYKKATEIARLLLLKYHPDLSKGRNNVLALMFDMNDLWEKFILASLRKNKKTDTKIIAQSSKPFWQAKKGRRSFMKPDILIQKKGINIVLDTKWKNLNGANPTAADLRQMYVYHEYYGAKKVALIYPGFKDDKKSGRYVDPKTNLKLDKECSIISLAIETNIDNWKKNIAEQLLGWIETKQIINRI